MPGIRDVVNLGSAMVRGGFFKEGAGGGDGSERQTRAMVLEKNVISSTVIPDRRSSGSGVISICECSFRSVFFTMIIIVADDGELIPAGMIRMSICRLLRQILRKWVLKFFFLTF
jgi:hypothetical protein